MDLGGVRQRSSGALIFAPTPQERRSTQTFIELQERLEEVTDIRDELQEKLEEVREMLLNKGEA